MKRQSPAPHDREGPHGAPDAPDALDAPDLPDAVKQAVQRLGSSPSPVLLRLPISHYCRKAEWGLSLAGTSYRRLDVSLPQMRKVRRANPVQRTVPVLVDGHTLLQDSHAILRWCDDHRTPSVASFYPDAQAQAIHAWEDWTDQTIGPLVRRLAYRVLAKDPAAYGRTRVQRIGLRLRRPMFRSVARYLKVGESVEEDDSLLPEVVARVAEALRATQTGFLFTDHITGADIATAALLHPLRPVVHVWALDEDPGWQEVDRFMRTVRPNRLRVVSSRSVQEKDWQAFEVLNQAHGTLKRPTAAEYA